MEVTLTAMAHGGEAIGRHKGQVVFVPYALPGERVRVRITESKKNYARAELVEILEPSPQRTQPLCRHFGECGGCQWQHIAYPAQLAYKQQIIAGQLAHLGGLTEANVAPVFGMETPWNYRNHAHFAVDEEGNLGYLAASSHRVVPIEECYLLHSLLEEALSALDVELPGLKSLALRAGVATGDLLLILETEDDEVPEIEVELPLSCVLRTSRGEIITLVGRDHIYEELAGRRYRVSADSFFQVNTTQAEYLVRLLAEALAPRGNEVLLDLYCGVGTFGLALADSVREVIGIEESPSAIADALANAEGCDNVTLLEGRAEEILPELDRHIDLAVVDPPRAGMERRAREALIKLHPQRIAYVSCDPASLARDLKHLVAAGYVLAQVWPVDMFPQTYHTECIALLEERASAPKGLR